MPFTLHEPFPTYNHHASIPFGRGGAGNRTSTSPTKPLPPSSLANNNNTTTTTSMSQLHPGPSYSTGRGGAGNMHNSSASERTVFHFDEELEQEKRRLSNAAPVYHVGRGGTGNTINARSGGGGGGGSERRDSESSGSGSEKGSKKSAEWVKGVVGKK